MKHSLIAAILLVLASSAFADDAAPKSTTIGGGVNNPWRSPYRTALALPPDHTLLHP